MLLWPKVNSVILSNEMFLNCLYSSEQHSKQNILFIKRLQESCQYIYIILQMLNLKSPFVCCFTGHLSSCSLQLTEQCLFKKICDRKCHGKKCIVKSQPTRGKAQAGTVNTYNPNSMSVLCSKRRQRGTKQKLIRGLKGKNRANFISF